MKALAAVLLGAAAVAWAATPQVHKNYATFALLVAVVCVAGGGLRLALAAIPVPQDAFLLTGPVRGWVAFLRFLRFPPWEEIAAAALVWLEVIHGSRPWHTAVFGLVVIAYLLAVHLAESRSGPGALWSSAPALGLGVVLLGLGAGFGMLSGLSPGAGSAWLRVLASAAVICAAGLALPSVQRGGPDGH